MMLLSQGEARVGGVHHAVSAEHLQSFLESTFRHNDRDEPGWMFEAFLGRVGKA